MSKCDRCGYDTTFDGAHVCQPQVNLQHIVTDNSETFKNALARIEQLERENAALLEALKEVVAISDRKHDAWDKAHAVIAEIGKKE